MSDSPAWFDVWSLIDYDDSSVDENGFLIEIDCWSAVQVENALPKAEDSPASAAAVAYRRRGLRLTEPG